MTQNIITYIQVLAAEKNLDPEDIFTALELALATVTEKNFDEEVHLQRPELAHEQYSRRATRVPVVLQQTVPARLHRRIAARLRSTGIPFRPRHAATPAVRDRGGMASAQRS